MNEFSDLSEACDEFPVFAFRLTFSAHAQVSYQVRESDDVRMLRHCDWNCSVTASALRPKESWLPEPPALTSVQHPLTVPVKA